MEIDPYALAILCFLFFVMGGLVGVCFTAWALRRKKENEEKLLKKYEKEHKGTP